MELSASSASSCSVHALLWVGVREMVGRGRKGRGGMGVREGSGDDEGDGPSMQKGYGLPKGGDKMWLTNTLELWFLFFLSFGLAKACESDEMEDC